MFKCLGPFFHDWSRAWWDKNQQHNYQTCTLCGRRRVSPIQFTTAVRNAEVNNE